jgi:hypothetical protein
MEFILNYNVRLDVGFIKEFNTCLSSLDNFHETEDDTERSSESFSKYTLGTSYKVHIDHTDDIINIQNFEKIISNNQEDYAVPFLFDSNSVFNYSANYFVNLQELYTIMNTKNYNIRSLFDKYLDQFVAYNLELSLFDAKTQAMHSIQYLLGFVNSIGIGNSFMSTKLFAGKETFDIINMNNYNKNFAESLNSFVKDPKFNFNLISEISNQGMSIHEFGKFVENSLNKYLKLDIFNFTTGDYLSDQMRDDSNPSIFNYYSQFIFLKYAIATYIVDKLSYLYNSYEASKLNTTDIGSSKSCKTIMKLLSEIDNNLLLFIDEYEKIDVDKLHLSVITLIYANLGYLLQTNYKFTNVDLKTVNNIIKKLIIIFDLIPSYQTVIIYILNAYANINYFVDAEDENGIEPNKTLDLNLLLNYDNFTIIKRLVKLLNSQSPETSYLSIVNLFSTLIRNYAVTLDIFNQEKVLLSFSINDRFDNTIDIREYQANDRSNNHILWCWTLIFYRNVLAKLYFIGKLRNYDVMKYSSLYDCVIDFILKNESRFYKVLSDTDYHDKGGNSIHKSLAYLDELELMTYIINLLFMVSSKWKLKSNVHFDFFNRFASNILSNTLKLFMTNIKLSNHYKCYSQIENTMNEIFPDEKDSVSNITKDKSKDERYTSIQSPVRKRKDFTLMKPIQIQPTPKKSVSNYFPSLFYSRVDIQLNKILYNVTNIIKHAVADSTSDPNSFLNYLKNIYSRSSRNYGVEVKVKNFEDQCQNILYILYFAIHSLESYVKNHETLKTLYSLNIIFFNNTRSSAEFGNLNLEYTRGKLLINFR